MLENALFVHAFGYMVELTVIGWCIIAIYRVTSNWFELMTCFQTTCFLTFIAIPTSFLKFDLFIYLVHVTELKIANVELDTMNMNISMHYILG